MERINSNTIIYRLKKVLKIIQSMSKVDNIAWQYIRKNKNKAYLHFSCFFLKYCIKTHQNCPTLICCCYTYLLWMHVCCYSSAYLFNILTS